MNSYFNNQNPFINGEKADAEAVNAELEKIQSGFDLLPTPRNDGAGFDQPLKVSTPVEADEATTKSYVDAYLATLPEGTINDSVVTDTNAWSAEKVALELTNAQNANDALEAAINLELAGKQDTLVSGTNIKTINGEDLLGSGDVKINLPAFLSF